MAAPGFDHAVQRPRVVRQRRAHAGAAAPAKLGQIAAAATVALLALALASPSLANERHPRLGEIEHEVMCPTCKTLLELSHAPIAERMRSFIRTRIAGGDTKSQIKAKLVAEFGEGVLAAPPRRGFGLLAWALPLAGLFAAASAIALIALRWRRATEQPSAPLALDTVVDTAIELRIDEELARYDG